MLVPVRCFTCGKPLAHLWKEFKERVNKGEDAKKVLDELGVERYCCRTVLLTTIDAQKEVARYRV